MKPRVANEVAGDSAQAGTCLAGCFPASCSGRMWYFGELCSHRQPRIPQYRTQLLAAESPQIPPAASKVGDVAAESKNSFLADHTHQGMGCVPVCVCGLVASPAIRKSVFTLPGATCLVEGSEDCWVKMPSSRKPQLTHWAVCHVALGGYVFPTSVPPDALGAPPWKAWGWVLSRAPASCSTWRWS